MTILLTGFSGFLGRAVFFEAERRKFSIRPVLRSTSFNKRDLFEFNPVFVPTLDSNTDWRSALIGIDTVIHCAAKVQSSHERASDSLAEFHRINVLGTVNLARQAAQAGVRRFIFVSSIKVNGESTQVNRPYRFDDLPMPEDAYGLSKAEAEAGLRSLSELMGIEVVIIRAPLVYGPGVKGNFSSLMKLIACRYPIPLGSVNYNRRSLVALDNLVDLILICVAHPKAANQTLLVSDGEDLSTAELLRKIGKAMDRPACLFPMPVAILDFALRLLRKKAVTQRLLGSLQVDIKRTCELLDWRPPVSIEEGLRRSLERNI